VPVAEAISPETAEWLDGPRLVEWLRENGLRSAKALGARLERRLGDWRQGTAASVYVLDEILVQLHLNLRDIPDDLWVETPYQHGRESVSQTRREVVRLTRLGFSTSAIAEQLGRDPSTVREHRRKAGMS
jgi:hypothetical protein